MIDVKQLKSLIKLMVDNDLTELDLQDKDGERVKLKRGNGEPAVHYVPQPVPAPAPAAPAAAAAATHKDDGLVTINSPIVGTFYAAPSPDADAFIAVGDAVTPESVVCLIEAMKVFNEIKAEVAGTVTEVLVNNGQAVEYDQPLFKVKPS